MKSGDRVVCPMVHWNGTSKDELIRQRQEFYAALQEAQRQLGAMAPNGRDYYVQPGLLEKAQAQDERRREVLAGLLAEIETEIDGIDGQG